MKPTLLILAAILFAAAGTPEYRIEVKVDGMT